jgi:hypothetical protein
MTSLAFPQLTSGAFAQYPIRKVTKIRTIKNIMADGSMLVAADQGAGQISWTLSYIELSTQDVTALQSHFEGCQGPLRAFTFLDPTENLLLSSADLNGASWLIPDNMTVEPGFLDPRAGADAFRVTNAASAPQAISQMLAAPASYQYCLSVYAMSSNSDQCALIRSSNTDQQAQTLPVNSQWSRLSSAGKLNDTGSGLSVAISLAAGQSIVLFGPQMEPQFAPSRFRPTFSAAGLYLNAHWAVSELVFRADAPSLFSTSFTIEASFGS